MSSPNRICVAAGAELTCYDLDLDLDGDARAMASVTLDATIQYGWPHPSLPILYVATSNRGPGRFGDTHSLIALRMDGDRLGRHGAAMALDNRPISITVDPSGRHLLAAYNDPAALGVHEIGLDGCLGAAVAQDDDLDFGIYPHQVRVTQDGRVMLVSRGNDATTEKKEDPGAIRILPFHNGKLGKAIVTAPGGGFGFGPRHLDFHPTQPFVYVAVERQNELHVYGLDGIGLSAAPLHVTSTLADPGDQRPGQLAGAIHVHPDGRTLYVSNRCDRVGDDAGANDIAVFSIDPQTGAPTLIQHARTGSLHIRTFALLPGGRRMVAAGMRRPAVLSLLDIGENGLVALQETIRGDMSMMWVGAAPG